MQPLSIRGASKAQSLQAVSKPNLSRFSPFHFQKPNYRLHAPPPPPFPLGPPGWTPESERTVPPRSHKRVEGQGEEGEGEGAGSHLRGSPEKQIVRRQPGSSVPGTLYSETRLRAKLAPGKFGDKLGIRGGGTWQQVGASQRGSRPLNTVAAGRSLAFSSSGAPRMIRAGQGRGRPCVSPGSKSQTKGERACST